MDLYVYSYLRTCAAYNSTVKAMGFDEIRMRYRKVRREVVREVILKGLIRSEMRQFVKDAAHRLIPDSDQDAFIGDALEDLELMDEIRLVGLGVTMEQLEAWQRLSQITGEM